MLAWMLGFPDAGNTKLLDSEQEAKTTSTRGTPPHPDGRAKQQKNPQTKLEGKGKNETTANRDSTSRRKQPRKKN